jgi:hypothetical protein
MPPIAIAPAKKHVNIKGSVKGPKPLAELVEAITTVHDIFLYLSTGAIIHTKKYLPSQRFFL